ncbi:DUF5906 domain-containing protein [Flavobacterium sp. NRK1]|uniref:DUF5906 domain-containing protein n=1 Tax=Flavobacterium sp. NRK1 TaxID=2954929 RepID=UPI002093B38D|nr:DUF5906 domain-containing protein [Flavobacterium sp. NRK1]MCO6147395.1 hypothetical protein [Flavobacterium sp. NRK1]
MEINNVNELTQTNNSTFYTETQTENGISVRIKLANVIKFWESKGYRKLKMPKGGYELVKIKQNSIISRAFPDELMQEVKHQLLNIDRKNHVWETFIEQDFISKKSTSAFDTIRQIRLNICDANTAYLFFKNGVLKVTKDSKELLSYQNYNGYVFEEQIIEHDYSFEYEDIPVPSCFDRFLFNVSGNETSRYNYLATSLGYLIHGYKDSTLTKAVILVDEVLDFSGEANGGTGKSLIGKAVSKVTSVLEKDGKGLVHKGNRFFYQDLSLSHRVLYLDDVNVEFNFEDFYSVVTGDLTVEEKYKASYTIPFTLSPKLFITSNYMVKGSGGNSDNRRRVEIEIAPYYDSDFTPQDEFGQRFFDDWDLKEWSLFYRDMIGYCQNYLNEGILYSNPINLKENKLKLETDISFVEFADANILLDESNQVVKNKTTLIETFRSEYPVESRNISTIRFKKWLDTWAVCRGLNTYHYKSNSQALVRFFRA